MHEWSVATEILRVARARVPRGARLASVTVAIGELAAVEPDLLRFAWEALTSGTAGPRARLEVEWRPVLQRCARCHAVAARAGGLWRATCPACGGRLEIEGGFDLDVLRLTLAETVPSSAAAAATGAANGTEER